MINRWNSNHCSFPPFHASCLLLAFVFSLWLVGIPYCTLYSKTWLQRTTKEHSCQLRFITICNTILLSVSWKGCGLLLRWIDNTSFSELAARILYWTVQHDSSPRQVTLDLQLNESGCGVIAMAIAIVCVLCCMAGECLCFYATIQPS